MGFNFLFYVQNTFVHKTGILLKITLRLLENENSVSRSSNIWGQTSLTSILHFNHFYDCK